MLAIMCADPAFAAERSAKVDWKAQVDQLSKPADDEVVLTATGDAFWNRSIINKKEQSLHSLFDI